MPPKSVYAQSGRYAAKPRRATPSSQSFCRRTKKWIHFAVQATQAGYAVTANSAVISAAPAGERSTRSHAGDPQQCNRGTGHGGQP